MIFLIFVLIGCSCAEQTCEKTGNPNPIVFSRPGDVNLGYVAQLSSSSPNSYCEVSSKPIYFQTADLISYFIAQINRNDAILPNVTLGFTVLDGCEDWEVNLARVWSLLLDSCHGIPAGKSPGKLIGMIGLSFSSFSVAVSGSLGIHRIPHIGIQATSDELSDKSR
jgi:hypothetical protein